MYAIQSVLSNIKAQCCSWNSMYAKPLPGCIHTNNWIRHKIDRGINNELQMALDFGRKGTPKLWCVPVSDIPTNSSWNWHEQFETPPPPFYFFYFFALADSLGGGGKFSTFLLCGMTSIVIQMSMEPSESSYRKEMFNRFPDHCKWECENVSRMHITVHPSYWQSATVCHAPS